MDAEPKVIRPTRRQRELLSYIEEFIGSNGYSPSYREIMTGLNYTSVATVSLHVNNLIKRGHLRKRDHSARSLEVVEPSEQINKIATKQLKVSEEKWLIEKVELFLKEIENLSSIEDKQLDNLYVLLGSLKVMGLDGAANAFIARLGLLRRKLAIAESESYSV